MAWVGRQRRRRAAKDFKVFVGNRGDRTGAFSCVNDRFLPEHEHVQAALLYRDGAGTDQQSRFDLKQRC